MSRTSVILIHGYLGAPAGLQTIADSLSQHFDVHIMPVPPFANAPHLDKYTPEQYANYVQKYIISQKLVKPVLVGHSMGSIIAAATAQYYPDIISDSLVLMSPISVRPPKPIAMLQPLVTILPKHLVSWITTNYLIVPRSKYREILALTKKCNSWSIPRTDLIGATKFSANYCIGDFKFNKRTLLLAGSSDRLISHRQTTALAKHIHADSEFLPESGHLINYECPDAVTDAILRFLS